MARLRGGDEFDVGHLVGHEVHSSRASSRVRRWSWCDDDLGGPGRQQSDHFVTSVLEQTCPDSDEVSYEVSPAT